MKKILSDVKESFFKIKRWAENKVAYSAVILIYHRVINIETDRQLLAVKKENFIRQIKWLKQNYNIISLQELAAFISKSKSLPQRSIVITFDDGYFDNFSEAMPILEAMNVFATFFISTNNINSTCEFWWDSLEKVFLYKKN